MHLLFVGLLLVLWLPAGRAQSAGITSQPFRHDLWEAVLQEHVSENGLVDYRALKAHPEKLVSYAQAVARYSPDNAPQLFPTEAHRLAYWINAYNALIVHRVVGSYPVDSIKDLGGLFSSVFRKTQEVGGNQLSYEDIEHGIIRKRFQEPRIHFVLNCASLSCAPLRPHALTAENLEATLQQAAVEFLNHPAQVQIDAQKGTVRLSRYFDWFEEDFSGWLRRGKGLQKATVLDYIKLYQSKERRRLLASRPAWKIDFLDYDWSLNDLGPSRAR